jgi:predicted RNA-binding Zn-ribbon protein involved in translation (DUF1610 family)
MKFKCPNSKCNQHLDVDENEFAGVEFNCPNCGQSIELDIEPDELSGQKNIMAPSSSKVQCKKCKRSIDASAKRCPNCGTAAHDNRQAKVPNGLTQPPLAETTRGLPFDSAIKAYRWKLLPASFCHGISVLIVWISLKNSGDLLNLSGFILGLSFWIISLAWVFSIIGKHAPQCASCKKKIYTRGQIRKCKKKGSCPFCGFLVRQIGVPHWSDYAPCPKCSAAQSKRVKFTWWGGMQGPELFSLVKCGKCGTKYNGKTGRICTRGIVVYTTGGIMLGGAIGFALSHFMKQILSKF